MIQRPLLPPSPGGSRRRRPTRALWSLTLALSSTLLLGRLLRPTIAPAVASSADPVPPGAAGEPAGAGSTPTARHPALPLATADVRRLDCHLRALNRRWSHWPGTVVRDPGLSEPHFLQHWRLLLTLAAAFNRHLPDNRQLQVVDVGAGRKPYYPLLASRIRQYVGIDLPGTPNPEVLGVSERLPLRSDCVDVVLSTQMLEHADDPAQVLAECRRILRPGGLMFASTHGVSYYHPIPVDHWRWTHTGLRKTFERAGFEVRSVEATGRTLTTLASMVAVHFLGAANRLGCERLASLLLVPFNLIVGFLDGVHRAPPQREAELGWGSMPWTYVVVAEKPLTPPSPAPACGSGGY